MKYTATPPPIATTLIRSSGVKPCQTARLYAGVAGPSTARTAVSRAGPIVTAGAMPTTRQASTRSSTGNRIQRGGSWGVRGRPVGAGPKNTSRMKRSE